MATVFRGWAAAALLAVGAWTAPAGAQQRIDPNRVFEVTVQLNGRMMNAVIREGGSLRLELAGRNEYHLRPVLQAGSTRVLLAVWRGTLGEPQTQRVVERVVLAPGEPVSLRSAPSVRIVLDAISRANPREQ